MTAYYFDVSHDPDEDIEDIDTLSQQPVLAPAFQQPPACIFYFYISIYGLS
jgi:hypothetical protein